MRKISCDFKPHRTGAGTSECHSGLADETQLPVDDVNRIYAETFERLNSDVRIKDYLILLTSKTVRDVLRHSRTGL